MRYLPQDRYDKALKAAETRRNTGQRPRYLRPLRLSRIVAGVVVGWLFVYVAYLALMLAGV